MPPKRVPNLKVAPAQGPAKAPVKVPGKKAPAPKRGGGPPPPADANSSSSSSASEQGDSERREQGARAKIRRVEEVMAQVMSEGMDGGGIASVRMEKVLQGLIGSAHSPFVGGELRRVLGGNLLMSSKEERESVAVAVNKLSPAQREILQEMIEGKKSEKGTPGMERMKYELLVGLAVALVNGQAQHHGSKLKVTSATTAAMLDPVEAQRLREVAAAEKVLGGKSEGVKRGDVTCFGCGEAGHYMRDCPKGMRSASRGRGFGGRERGGRGSGGEEQRCFTCGERGHLARFCKVKKEVKKEG